MFRYPQQDTGFPCYTRTFLYENALDDVNVIWLGAHAGNRLQTFRFQRLWIWNRQDLPHFHHRMRLEVILTAGTNERKVKWHES